MTHHDPTEFPEGRYEPPSWLAYCPERHLLDKRDGPCYTCGQRQQDAGRTLAVLRIGESADLGACIVCGASGEGLEGKAWHTPGCELAVLIAYWEGVLA